MNEIPNHFRFKYVTVSPIILSQSCKVKIYIHLVGLFCFISVSKLEVGPKLRPVAFDLRNPDNNFLEVL